MCRGIIPHRNRTQEDVLVEKISRSQFYPSTHLHACSGYGSVLIISYLILITRTDLDPKLSVCVSLIFTPIFPETLLTYQPGLKGCLLSQLIIIAYFNNFVKGVGLVSKYLYNILAKIR